MSRVALSGSESIDDVIERMDSITDTLPSDDGVAVFNRMYREVTLQVRDAVAAHHFEAGDFVQVLDVRFADLFFAAYDADRAGEAMASAWQPLFDSRTKPDTHPVQFALAGMTAHICHDLPFAVTDTCALIGVPVGDGTPEHGDFLEVNRVLGAAEPTIKDWFHNGLVARVDDIGGKLDDGLAMFSIETARAAAWEVADAMGSLADNPRLLGLFTAALRRGVTLTTKGILL